MVRGEALEIILYGADHSPNPSHQPDERKVERKVRAKDEMNNY